MTPETREIVEYRLREIDKKLDAILEQAKITNGRVGANEDNIIRLQERANPWAASGVSGGLALIVGAIYEYFHR